MNSGSAASPRRLVQLAAVPLRRAAAAGSDRGVSNTTPRRSGASASGHGHCRTGAHARTIESAGAPLPSGARIGCRRAARSARSAAGGVGAGAAA